MSLKTGLKPELLKSYRFLYRFCIIYDAIFDLFSLRFPLLPSFADFDLAPDALFSTLWGAISAEGQF